MASLFYIFDFNYLIMNFLKFLFSKYFLKQLTKAVFFSILILFSLYIYLKISTNHNQYIKVPNLDGINFEQAIKILEESDLSYVVSYLPLSIYNLLCDQTRCLLI